MHATDQERALGSSPAVVVFPESTDDVVKIVQIADLYRMPVIAYSGATSLEGHYRSVSLHNLFIERYTN